ncbi:hypothetical protein HMSSN036_39990 [Paenibacillus macerans]|nr:hypothetical protein HMSSN036_39990 [Paenibacillus macerans]
MVAGSGGKADCYRKLTLEVIAANQVVREIVFPNAFVVDYKEAFGDTEGIGQFELYVKQKKTRPNWPSSTAAIRSTTSKLAS